MAARSSSPRPRNLYWVETDDHDEDWFVVARTEAEARKFFAGYEGYDPDDPQVTLVKPLPKGLDTATGWPDDRTLRRCGAKVLKKDSPRVVEIDGRTYAEGLLDHEIRTLDDDISELMGEPRRNRTARRTRS